MMTSMQWKKKNLIKQTEKPKEIVVADNHIKELWQQIEKITEILNQTMSANGKFSNELIVVKNGNTNSENCVIAMENWQAKWGQYNGRSNIEITRIPKRRVLEDTLIEIYKDYYIKISLFDVEDFYRLPLGKNNANISKHVIAKFVNRKHSKFMLLSRKDFSS